MKTTDLLRIAGRSHLLSNKTAEVLERKLRERAAEILEIVSHKVDAGTDYGVSTQLGTVSDLVGAAAIVRARREAST